MPTHAHDQGTFTIQLNGSHTHAIPDATFTYPTINFPENGNKSFHLISGNQSNLIGDGKSRAIDIVPTSQTFSMATVEDHFHTINGTSDSTVGNQEFFIINPYQTVIFIIYAG